MASRSTSRTSKNVLQFSKRIATFVSACWAVGRLLGMVLIALRPEAATAIVNYVAGLDDVMMVNLGFYAGNSVAEKGILGYFSARKARTDDDDENDSRKNTNKDEDEDDEDSEGNG